MLSESFGGVLGELDRSTALCGLGGACEELPNAALGMAIETTLEVVEKPCDGDYLRYALETAAEAVEYMVRNYCVPSLWVEEDPATPPG